MLIRIENSFLAKKDIFLRTDFTTLKL